MARITSEVTAAVDRYYSLFSERNMKALPEEIFNIPWIVIGGSGPQPDLTKEQALARFEASLKDLVASGWGKSMFTTENVCVLNANAAIASGYNTRYKTDGSVMSVGGVSYLFGKTKDGWRVVSYTGHARGKVSGANEHEDREFRQLGMDRRIPRRDFLNGMALGVAGAAMAGDWTGAAASPGPSRPAGEPAYPPLRLGLRGQHASAIESFAAIRRGDFAAAYPSIDVDTSETYDLVIVGGGLSGLAAAYFWHKALPNQRVLVLDNHDDFGGHAKRNEFVYKGRTYLAYGGTMSVATPYPYSYMAKQLLVDLGVDVPRNAEFQNRALFEQYQLGAGTFFDKEHFGEDRLVAGTGRPSWTEFFAKAPLSDAARRDLARLYGKNPDYLHGKSVEQKLALLARISYQEFLLTHAKMSPDALPFFLGQGGRNNKRVDTTPALEAARAGRIGFDGLGLPDEESFRQGSFTFHFPDGNASIARLLVSRLAPKAIPGTPRHGVDREGAAGGLRPASTTPARRRGSA